jgi:hypothetical protein
MAGPSKNPHIDRLDESGRTEELCCNTDSVEELYRSHISSEDKSGE